MNGKHGALGKLLVMIAARGQYGHARTPRNFYMGESYCSYYWSSVSFDISFDQWKKVAKLSERYRRFVQYIEEVLPEWKTVDTVHYADNAVDAIQVSKDGRERKIQIDGPHGDACF